MAVEKKSPSARNAGPSAAKAPVDYRKGRSLESQDQVRYDEAIQDFHEAIDKVKLAYHLYFIGTNPKPPREERLKLDRLARQAQQNMPTRTMERFKMQSALIRYTHFCELWDKSIRKLEDGERVPWIPISHQQEEEAGTEKSKAGQPPAKPGPGESSAALARLTRPLEEAEEVRKIYTSYMAARKKCGEEAEVPFEKFQAAIAKQTEVLLLKAQAAAIQYRVEIQDNKVSIKAKPVKSDESE